MSGSSNDLARRASEAYTETWRLLATATGVEITEHDGLLSYFSMAPAPDFNPTVVTEPPSDPDKALRAAREEYARRGIRFGLELPVGHAPELQAAALRQGMKLNETKPVMAIESAKCPPVEHDVRRVDDADGLDLHLRVQNEGFGTPLHVLQTFAPPSILSVSAFFLAYDGDEPAATSILCGDGAVTGIYGVSTKPALRRRGLGAAATAAAVRLAHERQQPLVFLHASKMGAPVYARLGFDTIDTFNVYVDV